MHALRFASDAVNPRLGRRICPISEAPRLLVVKILAREKSTRGLSPSVSVALSRIPSNRFHSAFAGLLDLVEEHEARSHRFGVELVHFPLTEQQVRLTVVPGGDPISLAIS